MSRANLAADFGSTRRTVALATKTLAPAPSRARRAKLSIEGLGGASALPLLTGGRASVAAMIYTGVTMGRCSSLEVDL
jgi:hypothetical protein